MATYRAIFGKPGLDRYAMQAVPPIHIIVDNGKVTLEGVVATEADKNQAGIVRQRRQRRLLGDQQSSRGRRQVARQPMQACSAEPYCLVPSQ